MKIVKVGNETIERCADNKRQQAKKIINDCVELGVGVYSIIDDEHIFTSNIRMVEWLKVAIWRKCREQNNFEIKVITKDNYSKIFVVINEVGDKE